ncbi:peptidyl-prolyl cis-trans isomerase D-like isoform X6 [Varroa destructor]|uniref:peptidylprolyl isomerase n=1 Tax=Varroa destructor TaxID=109461 RepID=A0A7M7JMJ7_VARDE|nr:peptidyl-prolyl cis-trans isomerase D-like isoform X6 [Varroa destructor]
MLSDDIDCARRMTAKTMHGLVVNPFGWTPMEIRYCQREFNMNPMSELQNMESPGPVGADSPHVFLDIRIGDELVGRVVFELWEHLFPSTVANFVAIVKGSARGSSGKLLSYRGTRIHKVIPNFAIQGGDAVNNDGTGSDSIFGRFFPNEGPWIPHDEPGLLGMASNGPNTNGCQFYITTVPGCEHLNGQHTVFGKVIMGMGVIREVEVVSTHSDVPDEDIVIENCGIFQVGMLLGPEDPTGEDRYPPFPEDCPTSLLNQRSLQRDLTHANKLVPTDASILAELKACRGEKATYCAKEIQVYKKYFAGLNDTQKAQAENVQPQQDPQQQHQVEAQTQMQPQRQDVAHSNLPAQPFPSPPSANNTLQCQQQEPIDHHAGPSGYAPPVQRVAAMQVQANSDDSDDTMS